ncbi:MAG TPA: DUF3352 domain-containing protein [Solirubrobacterales bacterium]
MPRAAFAFAAAAAALLTGCGGGGGTTTSFTGPDPATVAPADAPLFAEAVVRPAGDQKDALDSALSKLLATDDPGGFILERLDRALGEQAKGFTFENDVAPWLGSRAGVFLETFTDDADGAAVLAVTNPAAARDAIDKASAASDERQRHATYDGVPYDSSGSTATGLVGDFLVTGSEGAFKEAVDASQGSSLADSGDFSARLAAAPEDQIAFLYAEPRGIVDALERSGELTAQELEAAGPQVQTLLSQPATASVSATADDVSLELSAAQGSNTPAPRESPLMSGFPSDSWLAFASSDAGAALGQGLGAAEQALGFDLGAQLGHWAGDVGGFARGTSLFGLGGALVLETGDEQASAETLDDLRRALSADRSVRVSPLSASGEQGFSLSPAGVPIQVQFVQRDGKVVVGLGPDSVDQVFSPSSTLGDSDAFKAAEGSLGDDFPPVAFLDFVPLLQLVESFQQAAEDPDYQQAKPYLDHLASLAVGGRSEGDRASVRVVLGLRDAPSTAGAPTGASPAAALVP